MQRLISAIDFSSFYVEKYSSEKNSSENEWFSRYSMFCVKEYQSEIKDISKSVNFLDDFPSIFLCAKRPEKLIRVGKII